MQRPELASTAQYIAWYARHAPDATAVVENGSHVTYRTMAADLVRRVRAIEALGVRPEMLVGVQSSECYPHLLLLLACEAVGAATASLTTDQLAPGNEGTGDEIIRHCDIILASDAAARANQPRTFAIPPGWPPDRPFGPLADVEDLALLDREVVPDRMARIVKTSGTTGRPKVMMLSNGILRLRIARGIDRVAKEILANPRLLCLYRLGVGGVHMRVLSILQLGGTIWFGVMEHACALIAAGAVNLAMFTTADLERISRHAQLPPAGHSLHVVVFGAAVPTRLRQQVRERLNARIENPYSASETNPIAMLEDDNIGMLCPGVEVLIVDEAGRERPRGETGIIRVRTETMVHGYFNDAALTKAAFIDGWYQTNDIGHVPEPGKLIVLGRADDMLNIGGVKIAPFAIEAQIKLIDGVSDAVVMSVAGPSDVDVLLAAVEIDDDRPPEGFARRIGAILSPRVSTFEIMPLRWFPRTDSGKVKRHEIEAAYRQRHAHGRLGGA